MGDMKELGELILQEAAREAAGNWKHFRSFGWSRLRELSDPENWAIVYTHNRDSRLLDLSNADAISEALQRFAETEDPDVVFETHGHFAVGHVDGFSIRVFQDGRVTKAFAALHTLAERLANYPILDEEDYSRREHEATLQNITESTWPLRDEYDLPGDFETDVFSWLWNHRQGAVENRDDQGGYPKEADLRDAFEALGYAQLVES